MATVDLGLEELFARLNRLERVAAAKRHQRRHLNRLGLKGTTYAKLLTPVRTGRLRGAWRHMVGTNPMFVDIYNNVAYAAPVNYGHRQTPGRFVPALGKALKADYVPGQYMLEDALAQIKTHDLQPELQAMVAAILKELQT